MEYQESVETLEAFLRPYCEVESARRDFLASVLGEKHPVLDLITYAGPFDDFVTNLIGRTLLAQNAFEGLIQVLNHAQRLQSAGEPPAAFNDLIASLRETRNEVEGAVQSNYVSFLTMTKLGVSDEEIIRFQEEKLGGERNRVVRAALFIALVVSPVWS